MNAIKKQDQNIPRYDLMKKIEHNDTLDMWADHYFKIEVTTSESSQKVQKRDIGLFITFMSEVINSLDRLSWTPRISKEFQKQLKSSKNKNGLRRWNDKTVNRMIAHLKTFSKWIHKIKPFPLGNPMEKIKGLPLATSLDIERAITKLERSRILDAADRLVYEKKSNDRRRNKNVKPEDRMQHKSYRPWRNRAIIYTLIETGMRRTAITKIYLSDVNFDKKIIKVAEKGNIQHDYHISIEGINAIQDYIKNERHKDIDKKKTANLFLTAAESSKGSGKIKDPKAINLIWNEVCQIAKIKGKSPHSARHAMGKHIIEKTGNIAAVQRQLGHKNVAYSVQYARISSEELQNVLNDR